jgi:hypothetical protein
MKKRIAPILLLLALTSCSDSSLQKIAKSMLVVSKTIGQVQTDVIAANSSGLVSDQITGQILQVCIKVNVAGKQIDGVLRGINALDSQSRSSIIALLTPISMALDPVQLEFIAGIKDPATKQKIEGAFILARSAISSVQITLAVQ